MFFPANMYRVSFSSPFLFLGRKGDCQQGINVYLAAFLEKSWRVQSRNSHEYIKFQRTPLNLTDRDSHRTSVNLFKITPLCFGR